MSIDGNEAHARVPAPRRLLEICSIASPVVQDGRPTVDQVDSIGCIEGLESNEVDIGCIQDQTLTEARLTGAAACVPLVRFLWISATS